MATHRRYSRKRSQRRNRRASRKMRGGENLTREEFNNALHTFLQSKNRDTEDEEIINRFFNYYERSHNLERVIGALELTFNLVPNSTLEEILNEWDNQDDTTFLSEGYSFDDDNNILNQTFGSQSFEGPSISEASTVASEELPFGDISSIAEDGSVVDEFSEPEDPFEESFEDEEPTGGKRKKRRTNKRKTNKRKTKKSKKTRKHRRRRHRGGADTFTKTTQEMDPYDNPNDNKEAEMLARGLFNSK